MNLRKGVAGVAASAVMVAGLSAGVAFADESYAPTTLGNPDYSNYTDLRNDIYVDGMTYVGSMSDQNVDTLASTAKLDNQIGKQADAAYALRIDNKLGQGVTKLAVKADGEKDFADLGLASEIASGDSACWWYEQQYEERAVTNRSGVEIQTPVNYTFQATLADGSTVEFHNVNMKGVLTLALCYSDDYKVNFVERTTVTNHTPDPTLVYEYNLARGKAADSNEKYTADEFNYHVNSAVRMGDRMFTANRGSGWDSEVPNWEDCAYMPDFGVFVPLYGEPSEDYTDGTYDYLLWNRDNIKWRQSNGDAGTWKEAGDVKGAGEYGTDTTNLVDYHPGMEEGDWTYTSGE